MIADPKSSKPLPSTRSCESSGLGPPQFSPGGRELVALNGRRKPSIAGGFSCVEGFTKPQKHDIIFIWRGNPPRTSTPPMHERTADAVIALVEALKAHPDDLLTMEAYGNLPTHLVDLLEDYEDDIKNA